MKWSIVIAGIIIIIISSAAAYAEEDYSFALPSSEAKKETLELSGNLDVKYSIFKSRLDSPMYDLQYYNQQLSDILSSYKMDFYLNGDYQTKDLGVHLKTHSEYYNDAQNAFNLFELYGDLNVSDNAFLLLGKKMYNWGKGYAFNPVGYVNPVKDPENPELAQAGILSVNYEYSRSLQSGPIKNYSFDLIGIPSAKTINNKMSEMENTDIAGKLYFLLLDTDLDLMWYASKTNPAKIGLDFSRNILPSIEMHGEFSRFSNQPRYTISNSTFETESVGGASYLIGLRWLNDFNLTTIFEYYHNDAGLNNNEFASYNTFLLNASASGDTGSIANAINVSKNYFSSVNLMRDYLYLKVSWPEPFNWVYFTPSIYTIYN
ncbi:hypothetical protein D4R52_02955, partial [bacterium]